LPERNIHGFSICFAGGAASMTAAARSSAFQGEQRNAGIHADNLTRRGSRMDKRYMLPHLRRDLWIRPPSRALPRILIRCNMLLTTSAPQLARII
jgi:hypothetical protein